jgi:AcrR family transcriptional regulator
MRLTREAVLEGAFGILDQYGLADLTMRRLAAGLGVQPGGLYWHFANKQTLLAAMADAVVAEIPMDAGIPMTDDADWRAGLAALSRGFRQALLRHRDGAELVAAGYAVHPGSGEPVGTMSKIIQRAGLASDEAGAAAAALTHLILGHAGEVQAHDQLRRAGALSAEHDRLPDPAMTFTVGLEIFLDGLASRIRSGG